MLGRKIKPTRRSREWWAALTKEERSELVNLERAEYCSGGKWIVVDSGYKCGGCGEKSYGGLCGECGDRVLALNRKADAAVGIATKKEMD